MVEVHGVGYVAGGTRILHDVSLRFRPNRLNVLLGPNGAGKSTLLKLAAGLVSPTTGEVRYASLPIGSMPADELARTRAVLSQHVDVAFPLSVEDVVLLGRYPHYGRMPRARDRAIVLDALDLVGMLGYRFRAYPTLSGGERQKVQLARVLAQIWRSPAGDSGEGAGPRVLFLDEPTSSLDVHYQLHLLEIARELRAMDCTVIAVLHDLNVALQYGDAFFLLDGGRLALETDDAATIPRELLERVFRVRADRAVDADTGEAFWRFRL